MINILALSGSLRAQSTNSMLLRAAGVLAPSNTRVTLSDRIAGLPLFNPDLEGREPLPVMEFYSQLRAADGILIASPEYAHGVSGVIKNALDWLVGSEIFVAKPVVLLNASPRASIAFAALKETVGIMAARIVEDACLTVPLLGKGLDTDAIVANAELAGLLAQSLSIFSNAIATMKTEAQLD